MTGRTLRQLAFRTALAASVLGWAVAASAELWPGRAVAARTLLLSSDVSNQLKGSDELFSLSERSAYPLTLIALGSGSREVRETAARRALLFERALPDAELTSFLEGTSEAENLLGLALVRGELAGELFDKVVQLARGKNERVVRLALEKLERAAPESVDKAVDTAILRLSDPSPELRAASFRCLGALPSLRARAALGFGDDSDERVRLARYGALFEQGAFAGELARGLEDPSPRVRARLAHLALHLEDSAATAEVGKLLAREKDRAAFEAVVLALGTAGTEASFEILAGFLWEGRVVGRVSEETQVFYSFAEERVGAALAAGGELAAERLRPCLEDRRPGVALRCTKAFLAASPVVAARPLLELERRGLVPHKVVLTWLTEAKRVDERGLVEAASALGDGDPELRALGLRVLEKAAPLPSSYFEPVGELLRARGRDPSERARALALLAGQGVPAREVAKPFLTSTSPELVRAARLVELEFCAPEVLAEWLGDEEFFAWVAERLESGMSEALLTNLIKGALGSGTSAQSRIFSLASKGPALGRASAVALSERLKTLAPRMRPMAVRILARSKSDAAILRDLETELRLTWVQVEARPEVLLGRSEDPDLRVRVLAAQRLAQLTLRPEVRRAAAGFLRNLSAAPRLAKWERIALLGAARQLFERNEREGAFLAGEEDRLLRALRFRLLTKADEIEARLRKGEASEALLRRALYGAARETTDGARVIAGCVAREPDPELGSSCGRSPLRRSSLSGEVVTIAAVDFRGAPLGSQPLIYRDAEDELGVVFTDADGYFDVPARPREIFDPVSAY